MLSPIELLKFGISIRTAIEKLDKKVAVIASGDLSHTLIKNGPYPYNPHGREFDNLLNNCLIREGHRGACNVREANIDEDGLLKLYSLNYGEVTSMAIDPIEKKPLYQFYPGSKILSVGSFGCNFKCSFCQNYSISQYRAESKYISPEEMAEMSLNIKDNIGLAFTYNEPSIWFEYVLDVAKTIKSIDKNHKIVLVSNGYISDEPLKELLPYIDAMNIDLKGNDSYYRRLCFGSIEEVKRTIKKANDYEKHIEVTTLLLPKENTDDETLLEIAKFLTSIDKSIPLHVSRYFPRYKMEGPPTSLEEMRKSYKLLKKYLDNVYLGNLSEEEYKYCIEG